MEKLFGTDGVRGLANTELSPLLALKLGTTAAHTLIEQKADATVLVGRDPRLSGDVLESALVAGILSQGVDAILVGVVPTPAVAYLTVETGSAAGAVISASHNPVKDNGIKFFGPDGYKLDDAIEAAIEAGIEDFDSFHRPSGADVGRLRRSRELAQQYAEHVKGTISRRLDGMRLLLDCANGSASELAPRVFSDLGAQADAIHNTPSGTNINENCGSLHTEEARKQTVALEADAGLSFDGDADRAILIDEKGEIVDGDHVMAICALHYARTCGLPQNAVIGTVMSNIGLEIVLRKHGISLVRTPVGDRYVSEEMRRTGAIIGGEKSGHIIFSRHATTGDGMITALQILQIMRETGKRLSELASVMEEFPQILLNVRVNQRNGWDQSPEIQAAIAEAEQQLIGRGRILVRASGTEKLIRVMAEGPDLSELEVLTEQVAAVVRERLC
ncbi:MAG: phosphoglucosamine mutase [Armatimonadota bacterium]|nr:phosphoglucosamine mutase [Armatimonadota bacterium]